MDTLEMIAMFIPEPLSCASVETVDGNSIGLCQSDKGSGSENWLNWTWDLI